MQSPITVVNSPFPCMQTELQQGGREKRKERGSLELRCSMQRIKVSMEAFNLSVKMVTRTDLLGL